MLRKVPPSLYAPARPYQIEAQLRQGTMPAAFTRRMRVLNLISATTLMKIEDDLMAPFDVMDLHHVLDLQISQDAIIDQLDNDELSYALATGNIRPLWDIAPEYPQLLTGLASGWIPKFFNEPFDSLCVMLAMRARLMLDVIDELGHSYNLLRAIGFGFIDFGDIPGEEPGDPGDYYPPEIDNPIEYPDGPVPPGPGEPGYVPGPGEEGYTEPGTTPNTNIGGGPGGGAPWGGDRGPGDLGGAVGGGRTSPPIGGDPCADVDDPEATITIGYTTQGMAVSETQDLSVVGNHPRWSYENYTWKISGGGGSLALKGQDPPEPIYGPEEEGYDEEAHVAAFEVTYTAPDTNAFCVKNPTIELWCGDALMASLKIAVNAASGAAYQTWDQPGRTGRSVGICNCYYDQREWSCSDIQIGDIDTCYVVHGPCTTTDPWYLAGVCDESTETCGSETPRDVRTEELKAAGCCPEGLL